MRQHSVALISLAIALSSLAYNTWRNEQTEANRNVRTAGIELLLKLGELDRVVFFSHYDRPLTARGGHALADNLTSAISLKSDEWPRGT